MWHFCEFCQTYHSSISCFHPGSMLFKQLKRKYDIACKALLVISQNTDDNDTKDFAKEILDGLDTDDIK